MLLTLIARRHVDELLVQEGLDVTNKKDDLKASSILNMCEKRKIPVTYMSKHDMNMLVDSRPHQGFILRAQPLDLPKLSSLQPSTELK